MDVAVKVKRQRESDVEQVPKKKSTFSDVSDEKLRNFTAWCCENNFNLTGKVKVSREGSCAQYGMVAIEDIVEGYCLFQVPRSSLLMPSNSDIADLIEKDQDKLAATNQWVPLLVSLLSEHMNTSSKWRPYFDIVPDFQALDLPLFWEQSEVEKLIKGTGVDLAVERDLRMIDSDYKNLVLPFLQQHKDHLKLFSPNFELFKKMVAFVMAYSFTEPQGKKQDDSDDDSDDEETIMSAPMMVPMADMLNHITKNNAKLTFGKDALKMVTTRMIKKGEEVYNTYGQVSNLHLMHMYGFAEPYPNNINDVVEIPVIRLLAAAKEQLDDSDSTDITLLDEKWKYLVETDVIAEDDVFVLGTDGFITDDVLIESMKVR
uniref:SET domain-containing protein n=2 Tax=Arion vulgaris TaxID=1028688 RepID=A0A0B7AIJ8_9EUPU